MQVFLAIITTKFYLDCRAVQKGKPAPLKIAITKKGVTAHILLNVSLLPSQWDNKGQKIKDHPKKQSLNIFINKRKSLVDDIVLKLIERGTIAGYRAFQIKDAILAELEPKENLDLKKRTFVYRFEQFMETKQGRTKAIYKATYNKLKEFCGKKLNTLMFEDINKDWLIRFENHLSKTAKSKNARNIHLRNIRTVFNDAIDNEITSTYPFRKFKIKSVATRKRALSIEQLRSVFNIELPEWLEKYQDLFKLSFFLIGINVIDLFDLKEVENGRIYYIRSKTHRQYSIKLEPEAEEIIKKYKGRKNLLNPHDTVVHYRNFYNRFMLGLNKIKDIMSG